MDDTKICSLCKQPAAYRREVRLSPRYDDGDSDWGRLDGRPDDHSPATLQVWTCAEHDDPVCDVLMERFDGIVAGDTLNWSRSDCVDAFHDGGEGETYEIPSGSFTMVGYRCPTCGLQTMTKSEIGEHPEVEETIASWFADRRTDA